MLLIPQPRSQGLYLLHARVKALGTRLLIPLQLKKQALDDVSRAAFL